MTVLAVFGRDYKPAKQVYEADVFKAGRDGGER